MEGSTSTQGVLKIGDYITIKNLFLNFYLCAEGILVEDIVVDQKSSSFEDSLFCIYLQRQYSAARELDEFLRTSNTDEKVLHALQRGRDNENHLNESYMKHKIGTPVCFGDTVQLFHVKSGKFVTIAPDQLARDERENIRIALSTDGNPFSWIQILPRYKIDRIGDRILTDTEVLLKAAERPNEYIHCSEKVPPTGYHHEVNCSLEVSGWRLSLYQNVDSIIDKNHLLISELVRIYDPETKSNVTVCGRSNGLCEYQPLPSVFNDVDVVTEPESPDGGVESNALWLIESKSIIVGGLIQWKSDQIRFRNLNTGKYLHMVDVGGGGSSDMSCLACTSSLDSTTLFSINEISSTTTYLSRAKAVQMSNNNEWLPGFKDKGQPASLLIHRYEEAAKENGSTVPFDVHVGISIRLFLQNILGRTVVPAKDYSCGTIWPGYDRAELAVFESMTDRIILYIQGYSISADSRISAAAPCKMITRRQNMICEQGTLDIVLRLIDKLKIVSEMSESLKGAPSDEEKAILRMGQAVLNKCLSILYFTILRNHRNQMFVADAMPILLGHIGVQELAAKCVTELLDTNMELQEVKVGLREISFFTEKLTASRMDSMYLHLLSACCSCQGRGVVTNQIIVSDTVFNSRDKLLISIRADYNQLSFVEWDVTSSGLYVSHNQQNCSPIRGDKLLQGLPQLNLIWNCSHSDLNAEELFENSFVDVECLFQRNDDTDNDRNRIHKKLSVANYLASELILVAEMCLGRNYVAMNKMEELFPYEILVTLIKMDVGPQLKSAAITLILRLYVDRDPQVVSSVPCLSRTWSEVVKNESPKLPCVVAARCNDFALLQQMISRHIYDMQGTHWESVSLSFMQLLHKLIMFNYYGSEEKLKDVIGPLIVALDRRKIIIQASTSIQSVNNKRKIMGKPKRASSRKITSEVNSVSAIDTLDDSLQKVKEDENTTWQAGTLDFLESMKVLAFIVLLVVVALALAIYQTVTGVKGKIYSDLDYTIVGIFLFEIILRYYCYVCVHLNFRTFFHSVLNCIDAIVVVIDLIILSLPDSSGSQYSGVLKAARLCRLVRIFRAARLVKKFTDFGAKFNDVWTMPARYSKTPKYELETMVEAVNVLSYAQRLIEDRNLSLLLREFYKWESGLTSYSPPEIFEEVITNSKNMSLDVEMFNDIFIDNLMYSHPDLVQVGLDVLMAHHSSRGILLHNAKQVQLLVSSKREEQFRRIDQMLLLLERNTETNDIWGELTTSSHMNTNEEMKYILRQLVTNCRIRRNVLEFDLDFEPDSEIQDLLRNLGFFDIALKILRLLGSVNVDTKPVASKNNIDLIRRCNEVLYWFIFDNSRNQALVFEQLKYFLDTLDTGVGSHKVIEALFKSNEDLMRACPVSLIGQMADLVCENGRKPQYLSLLGSITNVGEKNILENQYEIVKQLIAPARIHKMTSYVCPVTHPDYAEKVRLMEPFLNMKNVAVDDVPESLAYHLEFLRVLSGCTVGRINITTVEAKVQSVYDYTDILDAILDHRSMLLVKTRLALFFFNAMIEVEIIIPGLAQSARVWKFLESTVDVFGDGCDDLKTVEKNGWENGGVDRLKIEYMVVCAMIVAGFFQSLYDATLIKAEDTVVTGDKVEMNIDQVNHLISEIFIKVKAVVDLQSPILAIEHKKFLLACLFGLNKAAGNSLWVDAKSSMPENLDEDGHESDDDNVELHVARKYADFLETLEDSETIQEFTISESQQFISKIESLARVSEGHISSDVRYEAIIIKLVDHVRDRLETIENERRLDSRCTQTTTWIIRSFRTMIENRWGMTIDERDDDGGEEQDEASADVVEALNDCGATALCLDLISNGIDAVLQLECVKLCVAMLFKEGGNLGVQTTMYKHLVKTNSLPFFQQMRLSIKKLISWHEWNGAIVLGEDDDPDLPDEVIIVRFLQLMSEGHYQENQDIMREQPSNSISINLLDDFVDYFNSLSRIPCRTSTDAAIRIANTILEVIQGPCELNQEHFVLNTELIETLNRLMRAKATLDCVDEQEYELKKTGIDIFQGILEGQGGKTVVYERVLSVIHLDIIQMFCSPDTGSNGDSDDENLISLRTESLVLLQMLCDYKPSLRDDLEHLQDASAIIGAEVACVEILWRGELQRRFFHVPSICFDLAKASKDVLVENVDRSNLENKLQDFVARAHELYREINHQQQLKDWKVSGIFSRANQNTATWISFFLALIINVLLLCFYTASSNEPELPTAVRIVVNALNIFQLFFATFTLILFLVVRVPVRYQSNLAAGHSGLIAMIYTATDGLTMYYFVYLTFCLLAINYSDVFLTFLLLDIVVKNSTTRDVLNAVIYPRKQLGMTLILGIFVGYIFAFIIVSV